MVYEFMVKAPDAGKRLDLYLAGQGLDFSRSQIQKWGEEGGVTVNGYPARRIPSKNRRTGGINPQGTGPHSLKTRTDPPFDCFRGPGPPGDR